MTASVLAFFSLACGVSRLARYNVTTETLSEGGKVKYSKGTRIHPVLVAMLAVATPDGAVRENLWSVRSCWVASRAARWCCCLRCRLADDQPLRIPKLTWGVFSGFQGPALQPGRD
jgi:phosphatidylserine synthase